MMGGAGNLQKRVVGGLLAVVVGFYVWLSPQQAVFVSAYRAVRAGYMITTYTRSTEHGLVQVYGQGSPEDRAIVVAEAERALDILRQELCFQPQHVVRIMVDRPSASRSGSYSMGRVAVQAPSTFDGSFSAGGPVLHELTHLAVDFIAHGNYPQWVTEGLAVYMEAKHLEEMWVDLEAPVAWRGIKDVERGFSSHLPAVQENSYRLSFYLVDFLYRQKGAEGMQKFLGVLGRGEQMEGALLSTYGFGLDELEQMVGVYLRYRQEAGL